MAVVYNESVDSYESEGFEPVRKASILKGIMDNTGKVSVLANLSREPIREEHLVKVFDAFKNLDGMAGLPWDYFFALLFIWSENYSEVVAPFVCSHIIPDWQFVSISAFSSGAGTYPKLVTWACMLANIDSNTRFNCARTIMFHNFKLIGYEFLRQKDLRGSHESNVDLLCWHTLFRIAKIHIPHRYEGIAWILVCASCENGDNTKLCTCQTRAFLLAKINNYLLGLSLFDRLYTTIQEKLLFPNE